MKTTIHEAARKLRIPLMTVALLAAVCLISGPALGKSAGFSANSGQVQGFQGPGPKVVSVAEAKDMADDTKVALRGNIIQHLGGEDYAFQDASGSIVVEIDDKRWQGQTITPQDTVEISGKVDRDWGNVEIDAKAVTKLQP